MNIEDIRTKYQCDASQTFAQWKEWVRKNKPSQAQAHIVKAVAPNGSKYERLIGGYTDAQNVAFDLVSHGYKDVKLYHSVNAGPLKFLCNLSAPLHGAKFKDSVEEIGDATATFPVKSNRNGNKYGFIEKICRSEAEAKALVDKLKKEGFVANYKKVMYRDEADGVEQIRAKYCMDETNDQPNKKRYEVHYQATAPDGHIYSFIKEAVCTPAQLRGIMKKVEEEQKKKGVTLKKMFTRTVY